MPSFQAMDLSNQRHRRSLQILDTFRVYVRYSTTSRRARTPITPIGKSNVMCCYIYYIYKYICLYMYVYIFTNIYIFIDFAHSAIHILLRQGESAKVPDDVSHMATGITTANLIVSSAN